MNRMTYKVGRITVAVGLVAFGTALLVDNLAGTNQSLSLLLKLWPVLLIGLGLEYLARTVLAQRGGEEVRLRFDFGGAFLLTLVVIMSMGIHLLRGEGLFDIPSIFAREGGRLMLAVGQQATRTDVKTVSAAGAREVQVTADVGHVDIEETNQAEIRVEANYTAHGFIVNREEALAQLERIELTVTEGETVKIHAEVPSDLKDVSVRFTVFVPTGLKIKAETNVGSISINGYRGEFELSSRVGRIAMTNATGPATLSSDSGYIEVRNYEGALTARTSVGSLHLNQVSGPMQLNSGMGPINIAEFQGKLAAETKTGRIHASSSIPLTGDVLLKTQTGSVTLQVPRASSMRISAQTKAGSLHAPDFMNKSRSGAASSAVGSTGDGEHTVTLEASTGSVSLMLTESAPLR